MFQDGEDGGDGDSKSVYYNRSEYQPSPYTYFEVNNYM